MVKRLGRHPMVLGAIGWSLAQYLRLVYHTSRFTIEPEDGYDMVTRNQPFIAAMWHGQHFLLPLFCARAYDISVLISRHGDGEINARAASLLGLKLVRGSGDHRGRFHRKGGLVAFRELLRVLERGGNVSLTADVPKVARKAGLGIAMLARQSGRPVIAAAVATSRRRQLDSWDKAVVNLPFSRGALVLGHPVHVPADADDIGLEAARQAIEAELNRVTARAYAIADGAIVDGADG